ncbi:phosphotransferase [Dietzia kunjamensis]|uniref:phosphotransferase n=1 Tax=Dietzia kunjamensis TaxID=322509 RepID=UPI002DBCB6DB|nr:phosphotransferase [Dietzia kunjamensis]MEB8326832.1 phosphotransferase [Dietzia kunjamensis]
MTRLVTTLRSRFPASDALHLSANALIVSTAVTSVAGLAFWALAARWLPAETVGIGTALVSVLTLLANLATLGLRNGLVRFLPVAGGSTRRLITGSCLACALAAVALSGVFLVGQPWWAGHLGFLRDNALTMVAFAGSTVVWVLFVLQDHVLIGLRKSVWVPVKNLAYSIGKIAVLPVVTVLSTWAVLGATVLPAVLAVAAVGVLVVRLTRPTVAGPGRDTAVSVPQLARFAAADQIAWMVWVATPQVLTLIVLHLRGPEASAYYYMANMIGYSLYLITSNIGSALIAESVYEPMQAATHARTALRHSIRLVLPLAVVGVLVGPFALRLLGEDYAENAGTAMQLIILSALPQTIVGISVNTARVRRDMSTVVTTYVFLAVAIWGGSWAALQWWGVTGVGATILVAQSLAALGLLLSGRTGLTTGPPTPDSVWAAVARVSLTVRHLAARREERRRIHPALAACGVPGSPETRTLKSDSDTLVAAVSGRTGEFVLKIATSEAADRNLARHVDTVSRLRHRCDPGFVELLPRVLDLVTAGERTVVCETLLPGRTSDAGSEQAAAAAITRLHMATARPMSVTPSLVGQWVDDPVSAVLGLDLGERHADEVDRMAGFLRERLIGRSVIVSCTHGDFWPGNVLVSEADPPPVVTGIVDWENVMDPGLPDTDPVHWYLSTRPVDLGSAVCGALDDPGSLVRHFDSAGICLPNPHLGPESVVMLAWLWHVANTLTRSTRTGPGRLWVARNVHPVLRRFSSGAPSVAGGSSARHA